MNKRLVVGLALGLVAAVFACYWPVIGHEFIDFDDPEYVTSNAHVRGGLTAENIHVRGGLTAENIGWAFTTYTAGNWHPLTWLSLMLDFEVYGLNPGGFHFTNLCLHAANAALVFLALVLATGSVWRSSLVATVFAIHPLRAESVAWVSERKDVLCALFGLLATTAYVRYTRQPQTKRYGLMLALFGLCLMAKSLLVTLPCLFLLLDYWPLKRIAGWSDPPSAGQVTAKKDRQRLPRTRPQFSVGVLIIEKLPMLAMSAAASVLTVKAQKSSSAIQDFAVYNLGDRISNAIISYVRYMADMVWFKNLSIFYPYPDHWPVRQVAGAALILLMISALAIWNFRKRPWLIVGWLWFLGLLVPVIGLVQSGRQAMADRWTYLSTIGLVVMVVWSIPQPALHRPRMRAGLVAAAVALFGILCWQTAHHVGLWRNTGTVFAQAVRATRENATAHFMLGRWQLVQGDIEQGVRNIDESNRIRPLPASMLSRVALAFESTGDINRAIDFYRKAVQSEPGLAAARVTLGDRLYHQGLLDEAIEHYRQAVRLNPADYETHNMLAAALARRGQVSEAIEHFNDALRIKPDYADARENLRKLIEAQPPAP